MSINDRLKTLKELKDMAWGLRVQINEDLVKFENEILMLEIKEERFINDELQHQEAIRAEKILGMRNSVEPSKFIGDTNGISAS